MNVPHLMGRTDGGKGQKSHTGDTGPSTGPNSLPPCVAAFQALPMQETL